MNYWDSFTRPDGFSDGNAIPPDAEEVRIVYILALNALAEYHRSAYRVVAWNAWGPHNFYRVMVVRKDELDAHTIAPEQYADGHTLATVINLGQSREEGDAGWRAALATAMDMHLDEYVDATVTIDLDGLVRALGQVIRRQELRGRVN